MKTKELDPTSKGARIREYRRSMNMCVTDFAELVGVSKGSLYKIEVNTPGHEALTDRILGIIGGMEQSAQKEAESEPIVTEEEKPKPRLVGKEEFFSRHGSGDSEPIWSSTGKALNDMAQEIDNRIGKDTSDTLKKIKMALYICKGIQRRDEGLTFVEEILNGIIKSNI